MAHDDLPALFRRGCHLFRIRDGVDAHHSAAFLVQNAGSDYDASHRGRFEANARNGSHSCVRILNGSILRLVQRRQVRELHVLEPHDGALRLELRAADPLQYSHSASALESQGPNQHHGCLDHFDHYQHRNVARAVRDVRGPRFRAAAAVSVPIQTDPGEEDQFDFCNLDDVAAAWGWDHPLRCFGAISCWPRERFWWFTRPRRTRTTPSKGSLARSSASVVCPRRRARTGWARSARLRADGSSCTPRGRVRRPRPG